MDLRPNTFLPPLLGVIVAAFIVCSPIHAADHSETTSQIYTLLEEKQFDDAFHLASAAQAHYEGIVEFDLAYGLAAQSSAHCHLGLFSLERVLQLQPQTKIGRFALGNCYFVLGNYSAADTEFQMLELMDISIGLRQY